jgi:hypothetical protein
VEYTPDRAKTQPGRSFGPPVFSSLTKLLEPGAGSNELGRRIKLYDNKLELQREKKHTDKGDSPRSRAKAEHQKLVGLIARREWLQYADPSERCQRMVGYFRQERQWRTFLYASNRKKSYGWSHKSRVALIRRLGETSASSFSTPFFVTLTYHLNFPDAKGAKNDLKAFFARLKRIDEGMGYVWKMEFQDRGAPHFHCIIFPSVGLKSKQIRSAWNEIAQDNEADRAHGQYGTKIDRCEELKGFRKMYRYVSKYAAKQVENDEPNGRYWGTSTNLVDDSKTSSYPVCAKIEVEIRRIAKRILKGVKPYHGKRRVCEYNPRETKKIGGQYFELPKLCGYHRPDGKWVDKSRYGKQIAERFRGWTVHLLMDRAQAERVINWAMAFVY